MGEAWLIARREIRDALSDWRTITPMGVLCFVLPVMFVGLLQVAAPFLDRDDPRGVLLQTIPFTVPVIAFFPTGFSLIFALESFVGEKERGSLEPLFCLPVSTVQLYMGKLLGTVLLPVTVAAIALVIYVFAVNRWLAYQVSPILAAQVMLITVLEAAVIVSAAVVVSSHAATIRSANLLASFILIPVIFLIEAQAVALMRGRGDILWLFAPELAIVAVILTRLGVRLFDREEMLSRVIRPPKLGAFLRRVGQYWRQSPEAFIGKAAVTVKEPWWSPMVVHPLRLVRMNGWPLLVVVGSFLVGLALGAYFAQEYRLPVPVLERAFRWDAATLQAETAQIDAIGIFSHNVLVLLVMGVFSLLSFGSVALVVALLPGAVIGFAVVAAAHVGWREALVTATLVWPHGLVEFPALFMAAALGLRLGLSMMAPPKGLGLVESVALSLVNYGKGMAWALPLFLIAAFIEIHITPRLALLLSTGV
ncbi:MAG: stage II sporulation protein M [Chloroflexi bacterium]|nr:stage II sporulation protein M [Chloroflexota bacterium]